MSIGVRAKIAACLVTTLVIGVMTMYNANGQVKEGLTAGGEKMPGQPSEQALTAGPLSLPPGETGPVDKKGPIRKNKPGLHRNEAVAGISPAAVSKPDSMKAASQKSESLLPSIARGSLRIVAVEVPDSIPGYSD